MRYIDNKFTKNKHFNLAISGGANAYFVSKEEKIKQSILKRKENQVAFEILRIINPNN